MARLKASETSRDRPVEDAERVALWLAAEADTGPFAPYVQLLLAYSNAMHRGLRMAPLVGRDWCPPSTVEHVIRLSPATRRMVEKMSDLAAISRVMGKTSIGAFSWRKTRTVHGAVPAVSRRALAPQGENIVMAITTCADGEPHSGRKLDSARE
jgi:hypothetical protein